MFIITLTYLKPAEEIDKLLAAHREYLREQYDNGMFLMSGRLVGSAMDAIIELDPFKEAGAASYTITEFVPTMTADILSAFKQA